MQLIESQSGLRRARSLRGAIVIGLVLALVGAAVGTATGAVTPFQLVVVKNTAAEPIPVVGTVNVGNTPANQSVTVSNFPASQPVTMAAVAPEQVATFVSTATYSPAAGDVSIVSFGKTVNVTTLIVNNGISDNFDVNLTMPSGPPLLLVSDAEDHFVQDFSMPVPATGATIRCTNYLDECKVVVTVIGY